MNFAIITHVIHGREDNTFFAYEPYVKEMNVWLKNVDSVTIVAPLQNIEKKSIHLFYSKKELEFCSIPALNFTSIKDISLSIFSTPIVLKRIYSAMKNADHIHLRCPGNIGLLGCFVQILFPAKQKTAKYAGNWDSKSKQPLSYRIQKWILNNTFLTRNIEVLVYGEWEGISKNIKPFFTASYYEKDKKEISKKSLNNKINFLFVGSLTQGKNPLYAIQLLEQLASKGHNVQIDLYGEGKERVVLESYILENKLENFVFIKGNQHKDIVQETYETSHFLILPSKSEGWPKVVAEAMFWGCLPIVTPISCVPNMLDNGGRGMLLSMILENDFKHIQEIISNQELYDSKIKNAVVWSRKYTIDTFENEIKLLLKV